MATYLADDGNAEIEITADSAQEAAQEYVDSGSWGEVEATTWITVYVQEVDDEGNQIGDRGRHKIALQPDEPECAAYEHDWRSPHSIVGGLEENPGVHGHGGGVVLNEVCGRCGAKRTTDTWAQDRTDGMQGLESVRYSDPDSETLAYAAARTRKLIVRALESYESPAMAEIRETETDPDSVLEAIADLLADEVLSAISDSKPVNIVVQREMDARGRELIDAALA